MQKVVSIPNSDFTVPPVTSIAQSIISKRYVKIPINTPGIYSHNKNSQYPWTIYSDWGDNENFVDLHNTHLECDFTGKWQDPASPWGPNVALTPSFDQSSQALVNRLRIATSQGMTIEEIQQYNKLSNIIEAYTSNPTQKHQNLTNGSNYFKSIFADQGTNEYLDAKRGSTLVRNAFQHNVATRLILKMTRSSVLNRIHMLPLFNFRNGIRLEADFEDVYRAFVYQDTSSQALVSNIYTSPQLLCHKPMNGAVAVAGAQPANYIDTIPNWFVAPGTITAGGYQVCPTGYNANANQFDPRYVGGVAQGKIGGQLINSRWYVQYYAVQLNSQAASPFQLFKNTLMISDTNILSKVAALGVETNTVTSVALNLALAIPVNIYEHGQLKWRGFTLVSNNAGYNRAAYSPFTFGSIGGGGAAPTGSGVYPPGGIFTSIYFPPAIGSAARAFTQFSDSIANAFATNPQANNNVLFGNFALYGWDHCENMVLGAQRDDTIPYKMFGVAANANQVAAGCPEWPDYIDNIGKLDAELQMDFDHVFTINLSTLATSNQWQGNPINSKDPRALDASHIVSRGTRLLKWDYTINNLEWRLTLIKPASDVFTQYTTAFQKDIGIPYPFTRVFQFSRQFSGSQLSGMQQIQIPASVRSLGAVLVVLGDPYFNGMGNTNQRMFVPALSTFMRRGCNRIELVTGGTQTPAYRCQMETRGGVEHIPLLENFFGMDNTNGFVPSFDTIELDKNRNLFMSGNFDLPASTMCLYQTARQYPSDTTRGPRDMQSPAYIDSSKFVWGVNLAKKDKQGFASGLDTTMSGSLVLNFYFMMDAAPSTSTYDPGFDWQRPITVDIYGFADALFTCQNDANMVRW